MAPDMMFTSEKPWDPITLQIWPEGDSIGSIYQDDDNTTAFVKGECTTTTFHCVEQAGKKVTFKIEPSNKKFGPKQWIVKFHLTSVPASVTLDGKKIFAAPADSTGTGWTFDAASNLLTVNLPGERAAHTLVVTLDGSAHPRPAAPKVNEPPIERPTNN
jgi:hypothetical protein